MKKHATIQRYERVCDDAIASWWQGVQGKGIWILVQNPNVKEVMVAISYLPALGRKACHVQCKYSPECPYFGKHG